MFNKLIDGLFVVITLSAVGIVVMGGGDLFIYSSYVTLLVTHLFVKAKV